MSTTRAPTSSRRRFFAAAGLLLLAAAAVGIGTDEPAGAGTLRECSALPAFASIEQDGWRYEFHAVTGRERLVSLADGAGAENRAEEQPEVVRKLRVSLARDLKLRDLDELRDAHRDAIERLYALGYL